jgi:hypothetical protein
MALIHKYREKYPYPICMVPADSLIDLLVVHPLYIADVEETFVLVEQANEETAAADFEEL